MSTQLYPVIDGGGVGGDGTTSNGILSSSATSSRSNNHQGEEKEKEKDRAIATTNVEPPNIIHEKKHICSRFLKRGPPDLYGQRHAIESSKCISDSLRLFEREIWKLPTEKKSGIEQASVICPEIFESREHRLLFLRCEQFNVDVSVCSRMIIMIHYTLSFGNFCFCCLWIDIM